MSEFVKCRGDVGNKNVVNCPLAQSCLRYTFKSIGFKQPFMITPIQNIGDKCKMYITKENGE